MPVGRIVLLASVAVLGSGASLASAVMLTTLVHFNHSPVGLNWGSARPFGGLTVSGNTLYGTTYFGGPGNFGTVFSVPTTGGTPTRVASFQGRQVGSSFVTSFGKNPLGRLTLSGNTLYGTTRGHTPFSWNEGTMFSVPVTGGTPTTLEVGVEFTSDWPRPVIVSGSNIYRVGAGTVFSVPVTGGPRTTLATLSDGGGAWHLTLSGNTLYGVAQSGGASGISTVFSVPVTGGAITTLATFNGTGGVQSYDPLTLSGDTLYGITGQWDGVGTIFSVPVIGGTITTLATFGGDLFRRPKGGLTVFGGAVYGTTYSGGADDLGTVFSVPITGGSLTTLVDFNMTNGANPHAGLTLSGNTLFGTTAEGGAHGNGTIFSIVIPEVIPEPTTLSILAFGGLALLRRHGK